MTESPPRSADTLVLCCELKGGGLRLYVEPDAIESVREVNKRLREGWVDLALITTASGAKHLVRDPDRQVGPQWIAAKAKRLEMTGG